jgi:hypothetical protein
MNVIYQTPEEEWLAVLSGLWTSVEKPIDPDRLAIYQKTLEDVPLGLLELAIKQVIRENVYQVVPVPGVILEAVKKELENPLDVRAAIDDWLDEKWNRFINNCIKQPSKAKKDP